jgi:hypothetical protein
VGPVTEARRPPTLTLMGLGGEGPRGYEAGEIPGFAAEPGVAVKYVILTPLCTNLAFAVEALPLPMTLLLTLWSC